LLLISKKNPQTENVCSTGFDSSAVISLKFSTTGASQVLIRVTDLDLSSGTCENKPHSLHGLARQMAGNTAAVPENVCTWE